MKLPQLFPKTQKVTDERFMRDLLNFWLLFGTLYDTVESQKAEIDDLKQRIAALEAGG